MAEFKLGRIRFVWQGSWTALQSYVVDDVVNNGGKTYICVINHTSSSAFATDFEANPPKWNLVSDGTAWRGDWTTDTYYNLGDLVKYGGIVYVCKTVHTSAATTASGLEADKLSGKHLPRLITGLAHGLHLQNIVLTIWHNTAEQFTYVQLLTPLTPVLQMD